MARRVSMLRGPWGTRNGLTVFLSTYLTSAAMLTTRRWATGKNNVREILLIPRLVWFICRNFDVTDNGVVIRIMRLIEFTLTLSLRSEAVIM